MTPLRLFLPFFFHLFICALRVFRSELKHYGNFWTVDCVDCRAGCRFVCDVRLVFGIAAHGDAGRRDFARRFAWNRDRVSAFRFADRKSVV